MTTLPELKKQFDEIQTSVNDIVRMYHKTVVTTSRQAADLHQALGHALAVLKRVAGNEQDLVESLSATYEKFAHVEDVADKVQETPVPVIKLNPLDTK